MLWLNARNISDLRTGTRLSHAQTSQTANLEMNVTQCEMLYCFSWFMAGLFTQQPVYSYISNCSWKNKLSGVW